MSERTRSRISSDEGGLSFEPLEDRSCCSLLLAGGQPTSMATPEPILQWQGGDGPGTPAGNQPDVRFARQSLGLMGRGQTVAMIDTGVAYDHYALGGGLGSSYRVVGGWDFAENDANPYDDAPGGLHGTHVAGILGGDEPAFYGMAPQVDLVALRVFDDQGNANFERIEQALRWVHQHRHAFESPISTVNISIGSDWNSTTIPSWATLEDELLQLSSDGILVVASAGNEFASDPTRGLSYPAASPHVLPVGSLSTSGQLSEFTQRDTRMIAALGEWVTSTSPDYLFGFNGITDDFIELSGTSVAAPIVSGAAVLLREALQVTGAQDRSPARITSLLREFAENLYDPTTGLSYKKLNLSGSLRLALGNDELPGVSLGTLRGSLSTSAILQDRLDQDSTRFVAGLSGRARISLQWQGHEHHRPLIVTSLGSTATSMELPVTAGQSYEVAVHARGGVGRYNVVIEFLNTSTPQIRAAAESHAESRFAWTSPDSGTRMVVAEFYSAPDVDQFLITNSSGGTLAQMQHPSTNETFTIQVSQGGSYEFIVRGKRADAYVDIVQQLRGSLDDWDLAGPFVGHTWNAHRSTTMASSSASGTPFEILPGSGDTHTLTIVPSRATDSSAVVGETLMTIRTEDSELAEQLAESIALPRVRLSRESEAGDRYGNELDRTLERDRFAFVAEVPGVNEIATLVRE